MPYVKRTRPDLDTRAERHYSWVLFALLILIIGVWLVAELIVGS